MARLCFFFTLSRRLFSLRTYTYTTCSSFRFKCSTIMRKEIKRQFIDFCSFLFSHYHLSPACDITTHRAPTETCLICCLALMHRQPLDQSAQHIRQLPLVSALSTPTEQRQPLCCLAPSVYPPSADSLSQTKICCFLCEHKGMFVSSTVIRHVFTPCTWQTI